MLQEASLIELIRMSSRLEVESKLVAMRVELSLAGSMCVLESELADH